MDTTTIALRTTLSSRAWELARWADGRHVIIHGITDERAIAEPTPLRSWEKKFPHVSMYRREYTWDEVAAMMLKPLPIFGPAAPASTQSPTSAAQWPSSRAGGGGGGQREESRTWHDEKID